MVLVSFHFGIGEEQSAWHLVEECRILPRIWQTLQQFLQRRPQGILSGPLERNQRICHWPCCRPPTGVVVRGLYGEQAAGFRAGWFSLDTPLTSMGHLTNDDGS